MKLVRVWLTVFFPVMPPFSFLLCCWLFSPLFYYFYLMLSSFFYRSKLARQRFRDIEFCYDFSSPSVMILLELVTGYGEF